MDALLALALCGERIQQHAEAAEAYAGGAGGAGGGAGWKQNGDGSRTLQISSLSHLRDLMGGGLPG